MTATSHCDVPKRFPRPTTLRSKPRERRAWRTLRASLRCALIFVRRASDTQRKASYRVVLVFSNIFFIPEHPMIPDTNPILYACISTASTILAHCSSGDHLGLENLASKCLQNAPSFHRIYTQTIQKKIYIFLVEHPFVYFAIVREDDDGGSKSRAIEFLTRLEDSFLAWMALRPPIDGAHSLAHGCFNDELRPVFCRLMLGEAGPEPFAVSESTAVGSPGRGSSVADAGNGDAENNVEMPAHSGAGASRECSLSLSQKSGGVNDGGRQQARRIWRKHVRTVLLVDFAICCILFTLWMSICKGFRCVER